MQNFLSHPVYTDRASMWQTDRNTNTTSKHQPCQRVANMPMTFILLRRNTQSFHMSAGKESATFFKAQIHANITNLINLKRFFEPVRSLINLTFITSHATKPQVAWHRTDHTQFTWTRRLCQNAIQSVDHWITQSKCQFTQQNPQISLLWVSEWAVS